MPVSSVSESCIALVHLLLVRRLRPLARVVTSSISRSASHFDAGPCADDTRIVVVSQKCRVGVCGGVVMLGVRGGMFLVLEVLLNQRF